ncbi:MAG: hypothetical protein ACKVOK_02420 [Flavobacteriales bacterium]
MKEIIARQFAKSFFSPWFLLLFVFVAYWQLGPGDGILRWDGPHCFLAWRYNVTELIRSGQLPLWSTWQHLGFPLYGDPETGAWYPILWIMAPFRSYDFYSLHFEWLLHAFIGACGVYYLVKSLTSDNVLSTVAGVCFAGCGVFVSNAQNFGFLIGLAWAPWVLHYFRLVFTTWNYKSAVMFALVFWMMFTGSYPAITFMLVYSLIAASLYFIIRNDFFKQKELFLPRLKILSLMIVLSVGLCTVHLVSILECLPEMTRSSGLSVEKLLENSFTPQALVSFITPFAVGTNQNGFWGSDFSMINAYAGLLTLLLMAIWLFTKGKTRAEWWMMSGFVFLMIAAMGQLFPLRLWLAELPGLGVFRHPSIFRFLAIMILVVFAFTFLKRLWAITSKKSVAIGSSIIGLILLALIAFSFPKGELNLSAIWSYWKNSGEQSALSVSNRILFHGMLQLLFLIGMSIGLLRKWKYALLILSCIDVFVAVQLNCQETVVYPYSFDKAQRRLNAVESGRGTYDGEDIGNILSDRDTLGIEVLIENEHIFLHRPACDGYNSFILRGYKALEHDSLLWEKLDHPLMYCEDSSEVNSFLIKGNAIEANLSNQGGSTCILLQNFMSGWKCVVDGIPTEVSRFDHTFCAAEIPPGARHVVFRYHSNFAVAGLVVTLFSFLICLWFLFKRPAPKINIQ